MLKRILGFFSNDIAIDLGTVNTLIFVKDRGIVLREPSVVALQTATGRVLAVGEEARRMLGRTPGPITAVRPLKNGAITDAEITEEMLRHFIRKVHHGSRFNYPLILIAIPCGITPVERRALSAAARNAGAREVSFIEEPLAAALGAGIPIQDAAGNMVVDIGGGTTEVAIISLSGIVFSRSIRVAGDEMDEAIVTYLKRAYNLLVGERTSEDVKIKIGSAFPLDKEMTMEIKGRDLVTGLPKTLTVTSQEVREALRGPVGAIIESIRLALERCPPELAGDLVDRGIVLAGGGALLRGMDQLIREETGVPVLVAEDPLSAVAEGAGKVLQDFAFVRRNLAQQTEGA